MRYSWMAPLRQKLFSSICTGRIDGDRGADFGRTAGGSRGCDLYSRCAEEVQEKIKAIEAELNRADQKDRLSISDQKHRIRM